MENNTLQMMKYGLQKIDRHRKDYTFGGAKRLTGKVLVADGQWDKWLPKDEIQNLAIEPEACVTFATLNAVEILERQEFGCKTNWSDRFLAYISGTTIHGNNPQKVAETLRKKGDVMERDWEYTKKDNTWKKFYALPPQYLYVKALEFISEYDFGHEWVDNDTDSMIGALRFSPLAVAGFAWSRKDDNGYYYTPKNTEPCHYFIIYGYKRNYYWKAYDSYTNTHKKLRWNFKFSMIKRYTLHKNVVRENAWTKFLEWLQVVIDSMKNSARVGDYHVDRLGGKRRSPKWSSFKIQYTKKHPKVCAVCGGKKGVELHHILPFHEHPELELDTNNVIWLCRGNKTLNCHLRFGHWDNFRTKYNPYIINEAQKWNNRFTAKTTK